VRRERETGVGLVVVVAFERGRGMLNGGQNALEYAGVAKTSSFKRMVSLKKP